MLNDNNRPLYELWLVILQLQEVLINMMLNGIEPMKKTVGFLMVKASLVKAIRC